MCTRTHLLRRSILTNTLKYTSLTSDYLYGSTYISLLYNPQYNQFVIIFGETHRTFDEQQCIEHKHSKISYVIDYLTHILQTRFFFDFYMEIPYMMYVKQNIDPLQSRGGSGQLNSIKSHFRNCIMRSNCQYNNLRLHSIDSRSRRRQLIDKIDDLKANIDEMSRQGVIQYKLNKFKQLVNDISLELNYIQDEKSALKFLELSNNPIGKDIAKIDVKFEDQKRWLNQQYTNVRNKLLTITYYVADMNEQLKIYNTVKDSDNPLRMFDVRQMLESMTSIKDLLLSNEHDNLVDLYAISRMFHKFKLTDADLRKGFPEYAKNIVFYGGTYHAVNIHDMLIKSGYTELFTNYNDQKSCIKTPDINLIIDHLVA